MFKSRTQGALDAPTGRSWARFCARLSLSVVLLESVACSAVSATLACRRAERSVQKAGHTTADPQTTYELTLAQAYLDKAREEASQAEYATARTLAAAAVLAAHRAERRGPLE